MVNHFIIIQASFNSVLHNMSKSVLGVSPLSDHPALTGEMA
nr:MAG TPA: hypothetical protein [Caudoviricetes sp.]